MRVVNEEARGKKVNRPGRYGPITPSWKINVALLLAMHMWIIIAQSGYRPLSLLSNISAAGRNRAPR